MKWFIFIVLVALSQPAMAEKNRNITLPGDELGIVIPDSCDLYEGKIHCPNLIIHTWIDAAPRSAKQVQRNQYDILHGNNNIANLKNFRKYLDNYVADINSGKVTAGWSGATVQEFEGETGTGWYTSDANVVGFIGGIYDVDPRGVPMHSIIVEYWTNGYIVFLEAEYPEELGEDVTKLLFGDKPEDIGIIDSVRFVGPQDDLTAKKRK